MNNYLSAFSANLLQLIESNPDIDLAAELDLEQSVIDGYLDGTLIPSYNVVYAIATVYNLDSYDRLLLYDISVLSYLHYIGDDPPPPPPEDPPTTTRNRLSPEYIKTLPMTGVAWDNLFQAAQRSTNSPKLSDQNDKTDTDVLAKALVWVRTGETKYRNDVITAIKNAMGTETGAGILAIVRNTTAYVLSAVLVGYDDTTFKNWLNTLRYEEFSGAGPTLSIIGCHEKRPNNFGTHAGACRTAIAHYLNDTVDLENAIKVFKGWLGDRNEYAGFSYGDLSWQCDPNAPVGINPQGCTKDGHNIDGVLPDDQRRGGTFKWPPPKENYVFEALQGTVLQAELLSNMGYDSWNWSNKAILRAFEWLYNVADYPAEGDDDWLPWIINDAYGTSFPTTSPTSPGKAFGWADWVYA